MSLRQSLRHRSQQFVEESDDESIDCETSKDDWTNSEPTVIFSPETKTPASLQVNGYRRKINPKNIHSLQPGDHLGWHRPYMIWHHAIVERVNKKRNTVTLIHFSKQNNVISIVREEKKLEKEKGTLFRFGYPKEVVDKNSRYDVLRRARECLSKKGYNLITNNCEHFVTYCKTGRQDCAQVEWLCGKLKEVGHVGTGYVAKEGLNALGKLFAAEGVEKVAKASNWVGAAGVVVIETIHWAYDINQINKVRKSGQMEHSDYKATVTQRTFEGVLGAAGAIAGGLLGSLIPGAGSLVGSVIGGAVGNLIGKALGSFFGGWLGRKWFT